MAIGKDVVRRARPLLDKLIRKTAAHFRLRAAVFLWLIRQNKDNCREEEHKNVNQNNQQ